MTVRRLRFYLVFAATLVVGWLVACPAMAAGPLCDDRGASAMAPSPTLVTAPDVLDVAERSLDGDNGCEAFALEQDHAQRGGGSRVRSVAPDEACLPTPLVLVVPFATAPPAVDPEIELARPGVRGRVERPPRG